MYIKKLTIWLFMLLAMVSTACSDIRDIVGGDTPDLPSDGVVLTLKLPNFTKNTVATRATEQQINKLCVLCYDAGDNYLGMSNITSLDIRPNTDGTCKVKVKVMEGTATLHIVANTDISKSDAKDAEGKNNLYNATREGNLNLDAPVCWGSVKVDDLLRPSTKVWLFRQFAKASVTKDDDKVKNFEITGFKLFNTATKGTIATTKLYTDVSLPSSVDYTDEKNYSMGEHPFYETPAGKAYMIIQAKYYGGPETYYKVAFQTKNSDGTFTPMALLRNHHYQVKVTAVNHAGYSSAEEAEAETNLPENRLTVEVVDDNPLIVNMIACKDYELGVCGKQTVLGNAEEATITFVTTKPKDSDYNGLSVVSNDSWITVPDDNILQTSYIDLPTTAGNSKPSSTGRLYTIKLTLSKNYQSAAHAGTVTITSGDLSLGVEIKQLGYDFRSDESRLVQIRGLAGLTSDDEANYFKWMDKSLKGISPKENQGRVRNDGLHFFVGNNPVYYLIPKLQGDELTCNDTRVKVDKESVSGFYKVTLANKEDLLESKNDNNYNRWISNEAFTIITITNNKTNIEVTYPVYHVGLFAQLTTNYQLGKSKASGWRYYEMVDVEAHVTYTNGTTEDKIYHMLDRNLGATNNGYYSPSTTALEDNIGAIGGYFKISEAQSSDEAKKDDHVVEALAIGNFKVCDNMCLQGLIDNNNLAIVEEKTHYGEKYNCLRINTVDRDIPQIFIPMSGYYEGKNDKDAVYKDSHHANLWTSSRLSDYQGFSEKSLEYGFWYRSLDAFGKSLNLSNYRFVSGSSGNNTKRYRAMPVRLVAE